MVGGVRLTAMRRFALMVAVMGVVASCASSEGPVAAEPLPSASAALSAATAELAGAVPDACS